MSISLSGSPLYAPPPVSGATSNAAGDNDGSNAATAAAAAAEPTPEELLRCVVDGVNALLQRNYSLVEFDRLRGVQLLQVVNDVFATLQPSVARDMHVTPANETVPLMLEFLTRTLGYRVPAFVQATFPQSFADGEPTVIYPTLYWLVTHREQSAKRVYLSRFLQPIDVPEDLRAQDEDVRTLYAQYQQLRAAFVQTHKRVEQLRSAFADPAEARRHVSAQEEERDQLQAYIQAAKRKLAGVRDVDALVSASRSLRVALEDEAKLAEAAVEQQTARISADVRRAEMSARLQSVLRDAADGRVDVMVRRMQDEMQLHRMKLDEELPREAAVKQSENDELQRLLSTPLDLPALSSEDRRLDEELRQLHARTRERRQAAAGGDGASIATIQQQVQRVQTRKADVMQELTSLQADHNAVLRTLQEREAQLAQLRSATNMPSEEAMREFAHKVRAKTAATESMRGRLAELRAEVGTLTFTRDTLQGDYAALDAAIDNLESRLGLQGYSRTVATLSRLTQEKDTMEAIKGKTLEELARVVQEFTLAIREARTRLAPLVNELRAVRQTAAAVDEEWAERKAQYEYQESLHMEDVRKVDDEVTRLKDEVKLSETLYHRLQLQDVLLSTQVRRADDERTYRRGDNGSNSNNNGSHDVDATTATAATRLDAQYRSYEEYFADTVHTLETRIKDLQQRRRDIEDNHERNVQQVEWFAQLQKLLEAKLRSLYTNEQPHGDADDDVERLVMMTTGGGGGGGGGGMSGGGGHVGTSSKRGGADMLVLNSN